jgi:ribonuclease P/MRP protein subunit RPP40
MYADDTKIISVIKTQNDSEALQSDLNLLLEWSDKWLYKFNIDKCKIMHGGKKNLKNDCILDVKSLLKTE